jgi:hypothetical protein
MFHKTPKNFKTILSLVPTDIFQLCSVEGSLETQFEILTTIGEQLDKDYKEAHFYITVNNKDDGTVYAALEVRDEDLKKFPEIEDSVYYIKQALRIFLVKVA